VETPFDVERSRVAGVTFFHDMAGAEERNSDGSGSTADSNTSEQSIRRLRLDGIGPKMLVSAHTTHSAPFLHWRLQLRGNNAVELGVVPEALQARCCCVLNKQPRLFCDACSATCKSSGDLPNNV
jgi:hypothetical protein